MPELTISGPVSKFAALQVHQNCYSEAFGSAGITRDHWQPLMATFDGIAPDMLNRRQERVRRMRHEDGATFNPFEDTSGRGTPGPWK